MKITDKKQRKKKRKKKPKKHDSEEGAFLNQMIEGNKEELKKASRACAEAWFIEF